MTVFYTNIDTPRTKIDELKIRLSTEKPHLILINEALPKHGAIPEYVELEVPGYDMITNFDKENCHRGLVVYSKKGISIREITVPLDSFSEYLILEVFGKNKSRLILALIYRSPNCSTKNNELLLNLLENLVKDKNDPIVILGDFNLPNIDWTNLYVNGGNEESKQIGNKLVDWSLNNYMIQHITEKTRKRDKQESTLDLVFTNEDGLISDIRIEEPLGKSDHMLIKVIIQMEICQTTSQTPKFKFHIGDYSQINEKLEMINWEEKFRNESLEQNWCYFKKIMQELMEEHVPKTRPKEREQPLWFTKEVENQ